MLRGTPEGLIPLTFDDCGTYESALEGCKGIVDRLRRHIDPKIIEVIAALRFRHFDTTASCEGHLDHGRPYPWIDFAIADEPRVRELIAPFAIEIEHYMVEFHGGPRVGFCICAKSFSTLTENQAEMHRMKEILLVTC